MRRVFYFRKCLDFIDCKLLKLGAGFKFFDFDDLDSHCLIRFLVDSPINFSELTLPNYVIQDVILYLLSHCAKCRLILIDNFRI